MQKLLPWVLAGLFGLGLLYEMVDRRLDQAALAEQARREATCAAIRARPLPGYREQMANRPLLSGAPVPDWGEYARKMVDLRRHGCLDR
jgi:hypothetical protein